MFLLFAVVYLSVTNNLLLPQFYQSQVAVPQQFSYLQQSQQFPGYPGQQQVYFQGAPNQPVYSRVVIPN